MLLEIEDLQVEIPYGKMKVYPVSGVSFSLEEGEVLGIIGESGSGKSMAMKAIMGLLPEKAKASARKLSFQDLDLRNLTEKEYLPLRGSRMAMIFQDPMTALNPLIPIGEQILMEEILMEEILMEEILMEEILMQRILMQRILIYRISR